MIWTIVKDTIRNSIRSRKMHIVFGIMLLISLIILIAGLLSKISYNHYENIMMFLITVSGQFLILIALYLTSDSISREIADKRIDLLIIRPISRFEILYGRLIGYLIVFFTGYVIYMSITYVLASFGAGKPLTAANSMLMILFFIFLVVIVVNTGLGAMVRRTRNWIVFIAMFFLYTIISGIPNLNKVVKFFIEVIILLLPPYEKLLLTPSMRFWLVDILHILLYLTLFLIFATIIFNRREIAKR